MKNMKKLSTVMLAGLVSFSSATILPFLNSSPAYALEEDEHGDESSVKMTLAERLKNGIVTSSVQERILANTISAPGEVKANLYTSSEITSRISAQVIGRHVKMGDSVLAGQVLVTLSSVEMAEAQGDLILSQLEWERAQKLGKDVISEQKYLEARVKAQQARARVISFGMTESQVNMILKKNDASVTSGVFDLFTQQDGTIIQDDFIMGQFVEAGQPLMRIIDEDRIWVEAQLPPHKASAIKFGTTAWIIKDQTQLEGKVVQSYHSVDEESRTMAIRAEFDNSSDSFHSGEFVNISIKTGAGSSTLAVPNEAITILEGKNVVFHLDGEKFEPTEIEAGQSMGGWTEILSGIEVGSEIVTEQVFYVKSLILKSKIGDHD